MHSRAIHLTGICGGKQRFEGEIGKKSAHVDTGLFTAWIAGDLICFSLSCPILSMAVCELLMVLSGSAALLDITQVWWAISFNLNQQLWIVCVLFKVLNEMVLVICRTWSKTDAPIYSGLCRPERPQQFLFKRTNLPLHMPACVTLCCLVWKAVPSFEFQMQKLISEV